MNPRLYFDEKTLKKLGDVFVVNTYFPIKTVPDSADYFLLVYIAHSNAIHNIDNTSRKLEEGDVVLISPNVVNSFTCTHKDELTIAYCCAFSKNCITIQLKTCIQAIFRCFQIFLRENAHIYKYTTHRQKQYEIL